MRMGVDSTWNVVYFPLLITSWSDSAQIHAESAQNVVYFPLWSLHGWTPHRSTRTPHSPCGVHTDPRGLCTVRAESTQIHAESAQSARIRTEHLGQCKVLSRSHFVSGMGPLVGYQMREGCGAYSGAGGDTPRLASW